MKKSLLIALFVAFVDLIGIGLIYPLFSTMLFDTTLPLLPSEATHETRGLWLGILLSLAPFFQFFTAPVWGALSDTKGRKRPLQWSLVVALLGNLFAIAGAYFNSLVIFMISRALIGIASGNMAIVPAAIADLSSSDEKAKNYGLLSMAIGAGFALGPFFGGTLAAWGYYLPFVFSTLLVALNIVFAITSFKETHHVLIKRKLSWHLGLSHLQKAFRFVGLRTLFVCFFLHVLGWTFFFEFTPVYLLKHFSFNSTQVGIFYAVAGACYSLTTGVLIRPLVKRLQPSLLFFGGNLFTAMAILSILFVPSSFWLWPLLALLCYFVGHVYPTASAMVSNSVSSDIQGEALGILSSLNAAAFVLSALFSGSFVGARPNLSMIVSGIFMILAALIFLPAFRKKISKVAK